MLLISFFKKSIDIFGIEKEPLGIRCSICGSESSKLTIQPFSLRLQCTCISFRTVGFRNPKADKLTQVPVPLLY
jgi:hypothetical protein